MINIAKESGELAPFDESKLRRSLSRVGADRDLIDDVVNEVSKILHEGMPTRVIYRTAFKLLKNKSRSIAAKFNLKRAIFKLGTSGFPFEKYFAEILRNEGMRVATNKIVRGKCISHEVDVLATDRKKTIFVECKFHNRQGMKCVLKISLYVHGRYIDLKAAGEANAGWLVTNTRFSSDALKHGLCAGLHLIGWDFPKKGNLKEMIERSGLYPITCITNLNRSEITQLLADGFVLCRDILEEPRILDQLRIPKNRQNSILSQCKTLCAKQS